MVLSLEWIKGNDMLTNMYAACAVYLNGMVYFGGEGNLSTVVLQYCCNSGECDKLPEAPISGFAVTTQ